MIPKIIHYIWFGNNPMPDSVQRCIASWKKYCPDYEIKLWNESNYDISKSDFMLQAYEAKKYAFVSDMARLDIIAQYGGFYLDTDVELLTSLDSLRHYDAFMPMENPGRINTGLGFGAIANHPFILKNLAAYENRHFFVHNKPVLTSCVTITTEVLSHELNNKMPVFNNPTVISIPTLNLNLLPVDFMCPYSLETGKTTITDNTISIHHYDATWKSKKDHFLKLKIKLRRWLGEKTYEKIKKFAHI